LATRAVGHPRPRSIDACDGIVHRVSPSPTQEAEEPALLGSGLADPAVAELDQLPRCRRRAWGGPALDAVPQGVTFTPETPHRPRQLPEHSFASLSRLGGRTKGRRDVLQRTSPPSRVEDVAWLARCPPLPWPSPWPRAVPLRRRQCQVPSSRSRPWWARVGQPMKRSASGRAACELARGSPAIFVGELRG
jgi:hypothetical protein